MNPSPIATETDGVTARVTDDVLVNVSPALCAGCGKPLLGAGSKYHGPPCKQRAYRIRQRALPHTGDVVLTRDDTEHETPSENPPENRKENRQENREQNRVDGHPVTPRMLSATKTGEKTGETRAELEQQLTEAQDRHADAALAGQPTTETRNAVRAAQTALEDFGALERARERKAAAERLAARRALQEAAFKAVEEKGAESIAAAKAFQAALETAHITWVRLRSRCGEFGGLVGRVDPLDCDLRAAVKDARLADAVHVERLLREFTGDLFRDDVAGFVGGIENHITHDVGIARRAITTEET